MMKKSYLITVISTCLIYFIMISYAYSQTSPTNRVPIDYFQGFRDIPSIVDLFFPAVQSQYFSGLPSINETFLHSALHNLPLPDRFTQEKSETGGRPFYGDRSSLENFKYYDFTGDGTQDIVYSGIYAYAEGDTTLLWQNVGNNTYKRIETVQLLNSIMPGKLLKFFHSGRSKIASFIIATYACCAGHIDEFRLYAPFLKEEELQYRVVKKIQIFWGTKLPKNVITEQQIIVKHNKTKLRTSPEIYDDHDLLRSEIEAIAVYGNILAQYVKTSTGIAIGKHKDKDGKLWYFVVMDAADFKVGYNRFYNAYDNLDSHKCGWMNSEDIAIANKLY